MKHTSIFVLGLVGSILGLLGTLTWFISGTNFWSGFYDGLFGYDYGYDYGFGYESFSENSLVFGLYMAGLQTLITLAAFILSLIKSTNSSLERNLRASGIWLLVLGIVSIVINITLFVPSVLLIVAGSLAISKAGKKVEPILTSNETTKAPESSPETKPEQE